MDALFLRDDLARAWAGADAFDLVERLDGRIHRDVANRRTLAFALAGRAYFAKVHRGVGFGEIVKNWLIGRRPVLDAGNEYRACLHLAQNGIRAPEVAAFGRRGSNPARRRSFLVTDAIDAHVSLDVLGERWMEAPPHPMLKRRLIASVATLVRRLHEAGVNHRDLYLCHLLVDVRALACARIDLAVIDLHRARIRARVPRRWRLRDLAALTFSSLDLPLTRRDRLRFIAAYTNLPLRRALDETFWTRVWRRAERLYEKGRRKGLVKHRHVTRYH